VHRNPSLDPVAPRSDEGFRTRITADPAKPLPGEPFEVSLD